MVRNKRHKKAIIKSITWRLVSIVILFSTIKLWPYGFESTKEVGSLTLCNAAIATLFYYVHELIWQGKLKK